jgi:signal transduction histidine kinase
LYVEKLTRNQIGFADREKVEKTKDLPDSISVLLIEDSQEDYLVIKRSLNKSDAVDFKLVFTRTLEEALVEIAHKKPDVILADLNLPDSEGTLTLKRLKQYGKSTPIIAITGQDDVSLAIELTKLGAASFIIKDEISSGFLKRNILLVYEKDKYQKLFKDEQQKYIQAAKFSLLGEMSAGIAHEIANPLAVILNRAKLTARKYKEDEYLTESFQKIEKMVVRITTIVATMKNFSRDATKDQMTSTPLSAIIQDALDLSQEKIRLCGVQVKMTVDLDNIEISCRGIEISQVLLNLISNACDALEELQEKWISIDVKIKPDSDLIQIIVKDSGTGVPRELRQQIMQPFFTTKEIGKGTGIGLSISKGILEAHKGNLTLNANCPNTEFIVSLPLIQESCLKKEKAVSNS